MLEHECIRQDLAKEIENIYRGYKWAGQLRSLPTIEAGLIVDGGAHPQLELRKLLPVPPPLPPGFTHFDPRSPNALGFCVLGRKVTQEPAETGRGSQLSFGFAKAIFARLFLTSWDAARPDGSSFVPGNQFENEGTLTCGFAPDAHGKCGGLSCRAAARSPGGLPLSRRLATTTSPDPSSSGSP